jgi:hypothetical protein
MDRYEKSKVYTEARKRISDRPKICANCGSTEEIEMHHIVPLSKGGSNREGNLVYLCFECHCKVHETIRGQGEAEDSVVVNARLPIEIKEVYKGVSMRKFLNNLLKQRDNGYLRIEDDKIFTPWMKEWR